MDDEAASLEAYNNAIKDGLTILKNNYFLVLENNDKDAKESLELKKKKMIELLQQSCRNTDITIMVNEIKEIIDTKGIDIQVATQEYISKHPVNYKLSPLYYIVKLILEDTISEGNAICPITNKILENPVISKKCNTTHRFSREAIMKIFESETIIKCPYPLCPNSLTKSDILDLN